MRSVAYLLLLICLSLVSACSYLELVADTLDGGPDQAVPRVPVDATVLIVPEGLVLKQWNGKLQEVLEDRGYEVYVRPEKNSFIFEFVSYWVEGEQRLRVVWPPVIFEQVFAPGQAYTMNVNYPRSYQEALTISAERPLPIWMESPAGERIEGEMLYVPPAPLPNPGVRDGN
ncbi:MAG: hypothetical protein AAFZ92_01375 [Pseudomonadota bacterium]